MTEATSFLLPPSLILLVVMQFASAFLGWWLKRPLLPIVSTGILTGTVFACVFYQFMPFLGGLFIAIVMGVAVACFYCAVMDKALGSHFSFNSSKEPS